MHIGIDLGGTKIEGLVLDPAGAEVARRRVPTPKDDYDGTVRAIVDLARGLAAGVGDDHPLLGVGMPGCISPHSGLVKNANSTWLNGKPFDRDLMAAWGGEVRLANDANCLAVSEATDGAGAGARLVFAVIIGTGCGGGIAVNGQVHTGGNAVAGEFGHIPLPWPKPEEIPGPACYCGNHGCLETWISGTGFANDFRRVTGRELTAPEIVAAAKAGDAAALGALDRYEDRLARGLGVLVTILDPDVLVFGGGMSNIDRLYPNVSHLLPGYTFGREAKTPLRQAVHGDSSGVRGAAWLWPKSGASEY
jgi:fructokinase